MKFKLILLTSIIISQNFITTNALSYSRGVSGFSGKPTSQLSNGQNCHSCHNKKVTSQQGNPIPWFIPQVTVTGKTNVAPGSKNVYVISISGGQKSTVGFDVSVDNGVLKDTDSLSKVINSELTQIGKLPVDENGIRRVSFEWTAPDVEGRVIMYATGLSANSSDDQFGDRSKSIQFVIDVVANPPVAVDPVSVITGPFTAQSATDVIFSSADSIAPNDAITAYLWDMGDGVTHDTASVKHSYSTTGLKTIYLTVTTSSGLTNKAFFEIDVVDINNGGVLLPIAKIQEAEIYETGNSFTVDAAQSTATTSITGYLWDFGDGSNIEITDAATASMSHTYSTKGEHTITLIVKAGSLAGITTMTVDVTESTTVIVPVKTGSSLYATNCESCHGAAGIGIMGVAKIIIGASNQFILDAIDANSTTAVASMAAIALDAGDAQLIADYLGSFAGATADSIYVNKCELCHGVNGAGAVYKNIRNATATMISNAINQTSNPVIPFMKGITVSTADEALLAGFLKDGPVLIETGQSLYDALCAICHGPNGTGGTAKIIVNTTLALVDNSITNQPAMKVIPEITALTTVQRQKIVTYLKSNVPPAGDPVAGEITYKAKCQMCHGTGAGGYAIGILNASSLMIDNAIATNPAMASVPVTATVVEKQNLVALLAQGPIMKPTTGAGLFEMYCSYCHGATGKGGAVANVAIKTMGVTAAIILDAYSGGEVIMSASNLRNAGLTLSDRQAIANWLK